MKITRLTTYRLPLRWTLLEVEIDEGIIDWGEPITEGRVRMVETAVHELFYYPIGQDPNRINDLWQTMYRAGLYCDDLILMSAVTGIDQALWGIKGKVLDVPVYKLLGGFVHNRMYTYSWVGSDRPTDVIVGMEALQAVGFDHFRLNGYGEIGIINTSRAMDVAVAKMAEIRSAPGNTVEFGLDFHDRVSASMAEMLIEELELYRPLFIEKLMFIEQAETYARLTARTHLFIAAGERMSPRFDFRRVLEADGVSILQPDLSHAGGITECAKITAVVEAYDAALAPHCPLGPIALAARLYVDFVSWNTTSQEQSMDIHYNRDAELLDYMRSKTNFTLEGKYIRPPRLPGLGMDIDEVLVIECSKEAPDRCNPVWRHADGSVVGWQAGRGRGHRNTFY